MSGLAIARTAPVTARKTEDFMLLGDLGTCFERIERVEVYKLVWEER